MKKIKIIFVSILSLLILLTAILYFSAIFILPKILNSKTAIKKIEEYIYKKTQITTKIENIEFTSNSKFFLNISADRVSFLPKDANYIVVAQDLNAKLTPKGIKNLNIHYLYLNKNNSKKSALSSVNKKFNFSKLPNTYIQNGRITIDDNFNMDFSNLHLSKEGGLAFDGKIFSDNKLSIFKEYSGDIKASLYLKDYDIYGIITAYNLNAKMAPAQFNNAPVFFNKVGFYFDGQNMRSNTCALLAEEKACNILKVSNVLNRKREVFGAANTIVTKKSAKYLTDFSVLNDVKLNVNYHIKNGINQIDYIADIKEGSDIFYKNAYLGLHNNKRRLSVKTVKAGNKLTIKDYTYSIKTKDGYKDIISGNAFFAKNIDNYHPKHLVIKTVEFAPVSAIGFFDKFIKGGKFKGNIEYDFDEKIAIGDFIIKDFKYKDFDVREAKIIADKKFVDIIANGKYRNEAFDCKIHGKNNFINSNYKITIYDMDLFLNRYTVNRKNFKTHKHYNKKYKTNFENHQVAIDNWNIKIGEIKKDKIKLRNVNISGSLKNEVFKFKTSKVYFAKGTLFANGKYDFKNKTSLVDFTARNINSNAAADIIFNLPNQIEGTANAKLRIKTFNKLDDIKAYAVFKLNKGYLPKLAEFEFKNKLTRRKTKIKDITNMDMSNPELASSNITGHFYMDNHIFKNIKATSKQKYLSLLIEGEYDRYNDIANLTLFGKYNAKAQRRIKILFVPISLITKLIFRPEHTYENYKDKLDSIPDINAEDKETNYFRVKFDGSLMKNDFTVKLKRIL